MKTASMLVGAVGILVVFGAIYGRFHGAWTLTVGGRLFAPTTFLLMGNTLLLAGVFLAVLALNGKK